MNPTPKQGNEWTRKEIEEFLSELPPFKDPFDNIQGGPDFWKEVDEAIQKDLKKYTLPKIDLPRLVRIEEGSSLEEKEDKWEQFLKDFPPSPAVLRMEEFLKSIK